MYVHIFFFFFFNDTATTEIYTLSLHDALPIWHIDATLRASSIVASGAVVNLPGPGRHSIDLDLAVPKGRLEDLLTDRKSTRLNSSHLVISYAVFCLKKKKIQLSVFSLKYLVCF